MHAEAQAKRLEWRPFRVTKIIDESSVIRSFHLEPDDGGGLIRHDAGQHLPLRIEIPGQDKPVVRTYTLSTAPRTAHTGSASSETVWSRPICTTR